MDDMAVMSAGFWLEERGYHDKLFHTKTVVRDRACALTIDHWSSINAASIEMVDKLGLPKTLHPQPYYLRWGSDEFLVTHQTKVQFCMGKFSGEVCCDILLVYMVSCHLLLGKPWCSEQGAVPYLDHINNYYYKYVVRCGRVEYILVSMNMVLFKAWRDERLQTKKDKEEVKKKEAKAATIYTSTIQCTNEDAVTTSISVATVPSAEQVLANDSILADDDLKPRTVSFEEEEDDAAPPIFEVVHKTVSQVIHELNFLQFKQHAQKQTSKVESKAKSAERAYASVMDVGLFLVDPWEKKIGSPTYIEYNKASQLKKGSDQRRHEYQGHYYFARSRPPEFTDAARRIQQWSFLTLHELGWGSPVCVDASGSSNLLGYFRHQASFLSYFFNISVTCACVILSKFVRIVRLLYKA
jgi:hypothetical protein